MLCSFWAAAMATVGGEGEDYARGIVVLGLRVRRGEVEVLEYERRSGVRPVREGDLFALSWASGARHGGRTVRAYCEEYGFAVGVEGEIEIEIYPLQKGVLKDIISPGR